MPDTAKTVLITPEALLHAYAQGIFPMSNGDPDDRLFWVDPTDRGIIPLEGFHISRSLAREIRKGRFDVRVDTDFAGVVRACADRPETWINTEIFNLYVMLYHMGHAHSVEVYQDDALVGGVYGVTLGAAFFGESMFSRRSNMSKIALAYLVDRLRWGGFELFDTQFITRHLASLGAIEISRADYRRRLARALRKNGDFLAQPPEAASPEGVLQRNTHTS